MDLFKVIMFLTFGVICSSADQDMDKHRIDLQYHFHHLERLARFSCHTPQPRVIPVSALIHPKLHATGRLYHPDTTVLHRCAPSTGCCTDDKACAPVHIQTIHLAFMVTSLEDPHPMGANPWHLEYLPALNHTHCGCTSPAEIMHKA